MRILGIDPGTRFTGVGLIEVRGSSYRLIHCETLAISEKLSIAQKLQKIYQALSEMIKAHRPDVMALERFFYGKDLRAMVRVGEARACAMLAASEQGIDVIEYNPTRVKQAVTGNGKASKEQVQHMVKILLSLKTLPAQDSSDALAIAICHAHSHRAIDSRSGDAVGHFAKRNLD